MAFVLVCLGLEGIIRFQGIGFRVCGFGYMVQG